MINILINYSSTVFNNRDFLFESEFLINYNLDFDDDVFAYIVNFIIFFVQTKNVIEIFMIFLRKIKLNIIMKYVANKCYQFFL